MELCNCCFLSIYNKTRFLDFQLLIIALQVVIFHVLLYYAKKQKCTEIFLFIFALHMSNFSPAEPIGSAVLAFTTNKQTNRQTKLIMYCAYPNNFIIVNQLWANLSRSTTYLGQQGPNCIVNCDCLLAKYYALLPIRTRNHITKISII